MPTVVVFLVITSVCCLVYCAGEIYSGRQSVDPAVNAQGAVTTQHDDSLQAGLTGNVVFCGIIAVVSGVAFLLAGTLRAGGYRMRAKSVMHCVFVATVLLMVVTVAGIGR